MGLSALFKADVVSVEIAAGEVLEDFYHFEFAEVFLE
jgi:hypothetical protein